MNKYKIKEIIEAVDTLLTKEKGKLKLTDEVKNIDKSILKLDNELKNVKKKIDDIPDSTEKIISQAEKYLKK